ncbi:MAG: hypothetical protein GF398_15920 [Chitinivibrionales bacterium]|nr:hypothetical protein [Chitinivibrionales bacterium]
MTTMRNRLFLSAQTAAVCCAALTVTATTLCAEIIPLSPQESDFIYKYDFSISFLIDGRAGNVKRVKLYFDEEDVSDQTTLNGSIASFIPDEEFVNRPDIDGPHAVTLVTYGAYRTRLDEAHVKFYLTGKENLTHGEKIAMIRKGKDVRPFRPRDFVNHGKVTTDLAYRLIEDSSHTRGVIDAYGNGHKGKAFYNYNLSLTTDNNERHQSQQRFRIAGGWSNIFKLSTGDNWPAYNRFLIDNQRVRGIEGNLHTADQRFGLDITWGRALRAIEPEIDKSKLQTLVDSLVDSSYLLLDSTLLLDTADNMVDFSPAYRDGGYARNVFAARAFAGSGETFRFGFNVLKVKDDVGSIDQNVIQQAADTLNLAVTPPRDNFAIGADAVLHFWKRRLTLYANYALSLYTNDITDGGLSNKQLLSFLDKDSAGADDLPFSPDLIRAFIIINESTTPLPLPVDTNQKFSFNSFPNSMIWDAGVRGRFTIGPVFEEFEVAFLNAGTNFKSLANENLPVDKRGIKITEGIRLFDKKLYLRGVVKWYRNNLTGLKETPGRTSVGLDFLATFFWNEYVPTASLFYANNSERTGGSLSGTNRLNNVGATMQYTRRIRYSKHTISLSAGNLTNSTVLDSPSLDISLQVSSGILSVTSTFDDYPLDTRFSALVNTSQGNFGLTLMSPTAGVTWHIIQNKMKLDLDAGYEHTNDRNADPENEMSLRSYYTWNIAHRHSLFALARFATIAGSSYWDNKLGIAYEFRY